MEIIKRIESQKQNLFLPNFKLSVEKAGSIQEKLLSIENQKLIVLQSSGTTAQMGQLKLIALTKDALFCSAEAVNNHIQSDQSDIWLNCLPLFHVGGLGTYFRSLSSGAQFIDQSEAKWSPAVFVESLKKTKTTLTSLVPTQLFDIVALNLPAPKPLRAVILGGGALSHNLEEKARTLGWPVLPSYGLTECCSQVATLPIGEINSLKGLRKLKHVEIRADQDGRLQIKSKSLLEGYFYYQNEHLEFVDPKENGWFQAEDRVKIAGDRVHFLGRFDDQVKVKGELVSMKKIKQSLEFELENLGVASNCWIFLSRTHERFENEIVLYYEKQISPQIKKALEVLKRNLMPFEYPSQIYEVNELPKSDLGKILIGQLTKSDQ